MTRLSDSLHWQPALGHFDLVEAEADIAQAIHIILRTPKGSDPHRPDFGSNLHLYVDYPVNQVRPHLVREAVEAIRQWEPRCELVRVHPETDASHITMRVQWRLAGGVLRETGVRL
ncbi:GPW/gp25 family protein [Leeia aquatica]|uniref:Baseplate protein n=1 Tax=Leeia aquatica TaxID=2725557 RepID=A0A847SCB3_9NEIS|nr:GPW/gp25 family protein [Leeia aquatica]NLR73592.1 baseplate protein [Leeia aquatica]